MEFARRRYNLDVMLSRSAIPESHHAGRLLRKWRQRRKLSQLDLSCESGISTRHLSFLETGRSSPSRNMLLRLCENLDLPLRERNRLFVAAGYAPVYPERPLEHPSLLSARDAMDKLLVGLEPNPALVIDSHWTLISSNRFVPPLLEGAASWLVQPPVNVIRLCLHPEGLAPRIVNLHEWRPHLLERLRRQIESSGDPILLELLKEVRRYPEPTPEGRMSVEPDAAIVPLRLAFGDNVFSFLSTTMLFGTPLDITLSELAIECFFPTDTITTEKLKELASGVCGNPGTGREVP
jgi:transcriptional regulator with XRE-family HTH domain